MAEEYKDDVRKGAEGGAQVYQDKKGLPWWLWLLLGLLLLGLLLRWWSIIHLGRFFTVDVVIAADHRVVDSGPYRLIRHPSYTGALLIIAGVALCFGNFVSALVLSIPNVALLMQRVRIEETALSQGLGEPYRAYISRTKRLIPGVY